MKYTYISYDYSKILDIPKLKLIFDKDYVVDSVTLDKEHNAILFKYRTIDGISQVSISLNELV